MSITRSKSQLAVSKPTDVGETEEEKVPEDDWRLWFKPPSNPNRRDVASSEAKLSLINEILNRDIISKSPDKLDAARLKNVLVDMNAQFRVAALLPKLLLCDDQDKLDLLGEDVNRLLQLFRLQIDLAVNFFTFHVESYSQTSLSSSEGSLGSSGSETAVQISEESVYELTDEEKLKNRLGLTAVSHLISFKEAFTALCTGFRDTFDYSLLSKSERIFAETEQSKQSSFPAAQELCGLTKEVTEIFLKGLQKSPVEARELQKHIAEMTTVKDEANENKKMLWDEFQKVVDMSQNDHHKLTKNLQKNTAHICDRLEELRSVRLKAQSRVHRQVEDDNGPHKIKLSRMERDIEKTIQMSRVRNNQHFHEEKQILRALRAARKSQGEFEVAILEHCVELKTEIMALQDRSEILREHLRKDQEEEATLETEMMVLVQDRRERDERRRLYEEEMKRKNWAATVIQARWKGYITRKKLRKGRKKKGKKGKKGKGKSKGKSKSPGGKGKKK
ncbi:hypothetical protein RvY_05092 [Ramazzottius varieornatus]|uniref:Uncharacterized protein n=1 Tax=Ramazzottius varieornatus TaxID=947166 RepID=A0A1D1UXE2_RAMVA|nr:hypothetical protein RvY_05092 [Ramazzottius varieornatus]